MNKIVPDPPRFTPDREIFDRALRHYLQPTSPPSFTVQQDLSFEDALAQICDLLRCAAATAAGTTQGLAGDRRHMSGATEHLIDQAGILAERALGCLKPQ
ncbi:DUF6124 family protein [Pseudomonas brenneri]|jgi:hypothetical protein|uniref:DUF6124 family protein n=1 Tax=Pseudomonas brenneri TaxID=129817 RepID=UPI001279BCAF|nr:hypothetical protein [Pseudomonas brenneri]KAA6172369.1 hypothetical protein F3K50_15600 [Pseudomonas marginalis]